MVLVNLTHRGGVGADARTGDGAGILTQIPASLFAEDLAGFGAAELGVGDFAIAMVFLPTDSETANRARDAFAGAVAEKGLQPLGWRVVPTDASVSRPHRRRHATRYRATLHSQPEGRGADQFERDLMLARRAGERALVAAGIGDVYVSSMSARTIIYKGFCLPEDLAAFYADLRDERFTSAIALFHQRYSTNTLPTWAMAQPFRFLAHNGEINTVAGQPQMDDGSRIHPSI